MKTTCLLVLLGALALAACGGSLEGNGDVVTETRTVADFNALKAANGVDVVLTVDPAASGEVALEVTTDSNLQEFLTTEVSGPELDVSTDRSGGVTPTGPFGVVGTVAALGAIASDDGAVVVLIGSVAAITLSADDGATIDGEALEAATVTVDADNGAAIAVCVTGTVTGEVSNGASLMVLCGGTFSGVETSGGGTVGSSP